MNHYTGDVKKIPLPIFIDGTEVPYNDARITSIECIMKNKYSGEELVKWRYPNTALWTNMTVIGTRLYAPWTVGEECHLMIDCKLSVNIPVLGVEVLTGTTPYGSVKTKP